MKKAKTILSLLMAAFLLLTLAGCGKVGIKKNPVDDTAVLGMSFSSPAGYETVERSVETGADGKVKVKNIGYTFADGRTLAFAYTIVDEGNLEDELGSLDVERKEYNGTELILYQSGKKTIMVLYQDGNKLYGVQYRAVDEETVKDEFDKILQTVRFTDAKETALNDFTLDEVTYELKTDIPLYSTTTDLKQKANGTVVSKSMIWKYSQDSEKIDYRFCIEQDKNTKLADLLKEDKEYEETEINGTKFTFAKEEENPDALNHSEYFVQLGDDAYVIQNKGVSNGWFVSRSDESKAAFKTFIRSIVFE